MYVWGKGNNIENHVKVTLDFKFHEDGDKLLFRITSLFLTTLYSSPPLIHGGYVPSPPVDA